MAVHYSALDFFGTVLSVVTVEEEVKADRVVELPVPRGATIQALRIGDWAVTSSGQVVAAPQEHCFQHAASFARDGVFTVRATATTV